MKAIKYLSIAILAASMTACKYDINPETLYLSEQGVTELVADGKIYHLEELLDCFMTEKGNYLSDTSLYRSRATKGDGIYLFSIDTLPSTGPGIYIRGRVTTDDYGGNFYKALIIQEIVDGKQQNLRLSIDMGSASGMFPRGQELLIRCNGLAIGRYANQPQLCVPSYNNNTNANKSNEKIGWAPGRIPSPICRQNFMLIGTPDEKKLQYDTIKISEFINIATDPDIRTKARKIDGRLIVIKDIWFDGKYYDQQDDAVPYKLCNFYTIKADGTDSIGNPETDTNSAVFGPSTGNVGFPQSRCITDGTYKTLISSSEYAKYAHYYLPYEYVNNAVKYGTFKGNVRGILGYYMDNASYYNPSDVEDLKAKWSITICDLSDLELYADGTGEVPAGTKWGEYKLPDGSAIDLRKEWQKGEESRSILEDTNEE